MPGTSIIRFVSEHRGTIIANAAIALLAMLVFFQFFPPGLDYGTLINDHAMLYYASRLIGTPGFDRVYEFSGTFWFTDTFLAPPFRYLPSALFILYPIAAIPNRFASYSLFVAASFVASIGTAWLIDGIAGRLTQRSSGTRTASFAISVFFLTYPAFSNYAQGQVAAILAFLLATSMRLLLDGHEAAGCAIAGLALALKPTSYFILLFLLLFSGRLKVLVKRLAFMAAPLAINAVIFALYPKMLSDFIVVNTAIEYNPGVPLPSISLSSFILSIAGAGPSRLILFSCMAVAWMLVAVLLKKRQPGTNTIALSFIAGTAAYFTCQYDIWPSQVVYLLPFVLIYHLACNESPKRAFLSLIFYTLACFSYDTFRLLVIVNPGSDPIKFIYLVHAAVVACYTLVVVATPVARWMIIPKCGRGMDGGECLT